MKCFIQAPILIHWYLTLWQSPEKKPEDSDVIRLSRYVRNFKTGKDLFNYIVKEEGGVS